MAKQNKYQELSENIVGLLGGKANVSHFTHCVTRLRFTVKDKGLVRTGDIEALPGVMGSQWVGDQFQVVIGGGVDAAYAAICAHDGFAEEAAVDENLDAGLAGGKRDFSPKHVVELFLDTVSGIFVPFIPAVVCCGLLQGILYSIASFGVISMESPEYTFFYTCANTAFYFMPILIAFSAGKRFKCNPFVAAALGAALVHPTFTGLAGETVQLFGIIPITYTDYSSTVVPAILTVYFMSWVEKACKKVVPEMIDIIVTPFVSFILSALVGFTILAPLGGWIGTFVAEAVMWLYNAFGPVGMAVYALTYPFVLSTGMQTAFIPLIAQNIAEMGYDVLYPGNAASNAAMAACALYIFFAARDKNVKALGSSTGITALIGVTEPVLFGLVLRFKKALIACMVGGGVGGFIMGLFKVQYLSFGFVPFGTFPLAMTETFPFYLLGVGVAMVVTVVMMRVLKFSDSEA